MPPRNPELPEGTDHIVNGAMQSGGGNEGSGFVGSGTGDDTGGMSAGGAAGGIGTATGGRGTGGMGGSTGLGGGSGGDFGGSGSGGGSDFGSGSGGSGGGSGSGDIKTQLKQGVSSVQQQAGEKVRSFAETGKSRATSALDDFSQVVNDAADSIDERLGSEYGEYARRAADAVSGFADNLRNKEVDELFDDGRNLIRKSPGVAIGVAAVAGFALVRLLKSGMDVQSGSGRSGGTREIEFEPDAALGSAGTSGSMSGSTGGSAGSTTGTSTTGGSTGSFGAGGTGTTGGVGSASGLGTTGGTGTTGGSGTSGGTGGTTPGLGG